MRKGNILIVDSIFGNDASGSTLTGFPYKTIDGALDDISGGETMMIYPGTYTFTSFTMRPNTSIVGINMDKVKLNYSTHDVSSIMITMGENCNISGVTITCDISGATPYVNITGILFGGTTSYTSRIFNSIINVNNSIMGKTLTNTIQAINFNSTSIVDKPISRYSSIDQCLINVYSNGNGDKRGILVSNGNHVYIKNSTIFIDAPTNTDSSGSYVGIEVHDTNQADPSGSIQIKGCTISCILPLTGQLFTASDILQQTPATTLSPSFIHEAGIQIASATDLVTKTAGGKGFSINSYNFIVSYCVKDALNAGPIAGYLWPGVMSAGAKYPDVTIPSANYRIQQTCLFCGMDASVTLAPVTGATNIQLRCTPISTGSIVDITGGILSFSTTDLFKSLYNLSYTLYIGDMLHVYVTYSGGNNNKTTDLSIQLDLY